ncbi:MAG: hypothetical protein ABFS42_06695 [Candidatus Krumholzibacteriota bacterium]
MRSSRALRLIVAIAVFGTVGFLLRGYVTDDTFIHLRYLQNLLDRGEFSFNPGDPTYGATSPLWIFGLALLVKLGLGPMVAAWVLGAVSGLILILAADAVIERMTFAPHWKFALMLLVVSDVWFLRWAFSGMETPLATALLVVLLLPLVSRRTSGPMWHRYLAWGVGAGLAGLVRPEYLVMVPLALPWLLWFEYFRAGGMEGRSGRHQARPHAPVLACISGWLLVVLPWLVYAWFSFGRIVPETASAKSVGFSLNPLVWFPYIYRSVGILAVAQGIIWVGLFLLIILILRRHKYLENFQTRDQAQEHHQVRRAGESGSEKVGTGPWSIWGPVALVGIMLTWAVVLLGGLAVRQVWVISRYVSPLAPVILLALSVVAEWLMQGVAVTVAIRKTGRAIIFVSIVATLVLNWWVFTSQVLPHTRQFPVGVRECYLELGDWLRSNTPEDAVVAALDIGALGFASDRTVLDLMGLVSPRIMELGHEMGFEEMVTSGAWLTAGTRSGEPGRIPDFFVDRSEGIPRWDGKTIHGVRFELLDTCVISGLGLSEPQPWTVALYRLVAGETRVKSSMGG